MAATANQVQDVLEVGLFKRDSGEAWTVFFGLLISVALSAALGAGLYALAAFKFNWPVNAAAAGVSAVVTVIAGYFFGAAFGEQQGIADEAFAHAGKSHLFRQHDAGDDMAMGCLLLFCQFLFGGMHSAVQYFWVSRSTARTLQIATVLMMLCLRQEEGIPSEDLISQTCHVRRGLKRPRVLKVLGLLIERGYLVGDPVRVAAPRRHEFGR